MTLHLISPNIGRTRQFGRRLAVIGSAAMSKSVAFIEAHGAGPGHG